MQNNDTRILSIKTTYLHLRKRSKRIVLFVASVALVVIAYTFVQPRVYKSSTVIVMTDESLPGMASMLQSIPGASLLGQGAPTRSQTYLEIVRSREIARFIADTLSLWSNPLFSGLSEEKFLGIISGAISTRLTRGGLLEISVIASTPWFPNSADEADAAQLSANIANSAALGLDRYNQDKSSSKARRKRVFAEKMLATKKVELDSIDSALEDFKRKNKLLALETQSQATVQQAVSVGSELAKAQIELQSKLLEYGEDAAVIDVYRKKVSTLRNQFQKMQSGGAVEGDKVSLPLGDVPAISRRYVTMVRDQKILEQVIAYLESQKYQEGIQEASDLPTVEQLDRALVPAERYSPNRKLALLLAVFISLAGSVAYYVIRGLASGELLLKKSNHNENPD